ncbi:MAG: hypothetical protein JO076_06290, partial [Verrucomicrobia bacterium]|nr:hypothetical protein [Verrucomicrobiota bacterium]
MSERLVSPSRFCGLTACTGLPWTGLLILSRPGTFNFSRFEQRRRPGAIGDVLVFLNNDTEVIDAGWLRELVSQALRKDVGVVGAKLIYADGRI